MKLTILLMFAFALCKAPEWKSLHLEQSEVIQPYETLIEAVTWVESTHGKFVWNAEEEAVGWFQIRQIRVDDYNKRLGTNYKLSDFYDYELSRKMFLYYAHGKDYETAARQWNGSGKKTDDYWWKIQKFLYRYRSQRKG